MSAFDFDFYVIGAGSGGVRASRVAASLGARVAVCESRELGGTCVNLGCVPKKLMVYAAEYAGAFEDARGFGWSGGGFHSDWSQLIAAKDREIARLNGVYQRILEGAGVTIHRGHGRLIDAHTVEVDGVRHRAERILIATGGRASRPEVPGAELGLTSDDFFHLPARPDRVLVVGAGYIGVELAGVFQGLGSQVDVVQRRPQVLRGFDADVRRVVQREMAARGIGFHLNATVTSVRRSAEGLSVALSGGEVLSVDAVLWATGREPLTGGMGLASLGVTLSERGAVVVDAGFQTSVPSIYAVGDVIDRAALTPVALAEGMALARHLYGGEPITFAYDLIPTAVFSIPPAATVGLTESAARDRHPEVVIYRSEFRPMRHTLSGRQSRTMMKLVVDGQTDRVLGCHMVGADAPEIIGGIAISLRCGATKAQFDATLGIHPTASEELVTMRTPAET